MPEETVSEPPRTIEDLRAGRFQRPIVDTPFNLVSSDAEDRSSQRILDVAVSRVGSVDREIRVSCVP